MLSPQELNALKPIICFLDNISEVDSYVEPGMYARITRVTNPDKDGLFEVFYSLKDFDDVNRDYESSDWLGPDGRYNLTAREAGWYNVEDSFYSETGTYGGDRPHYQTQFMVVPATDNKADLLKRFTEREVKSLNYTQWLELKLIASEAINEMFTNAFKLHDFGAPSPLQPGQPPNSVEGRS